VNSTVRALAFTVAGAFFLLGRPAAPQATPRIAPGKVLVAREDLRDPNFEGTVVLVVAYEETGAMGVVLNRPSHMRVDHLLPHLELSPQFNQKVFVGGPVAQRQATILFSTDEPEGRHHVFGTIHVTGELALLERMVTEPRPGERYRVFAGHSGWAAGQLDAELLRLGWHVMPATEEMVLGDTEDLWETLIRRTRSRLAGWHEETAGAHVRRGLGYWSTGGTTSPSASMYPTLGTLLSKRLLR
jgi:putative transcriptional regulator